MDSKLLKFSLACATGVIVLAANPKTALAYDEAVAGFSFDKISSSTDDTTKTNEIVSFSDKISIPRFSNLGIADVDKKSNLMVRASAHKTAKVIGKLPRHGSCHILKEDKGNGWTKVSSGKVKGYVKTDYLITGAKASKLALEVGDYVATANTDGLFVREKPDTNAPVLDQIAKGEDLTVLDSKVITYNGDQTRWVKVSLDSDESAEGTVAYVAKEFVDLNYTLKHAVSMEKINHKSYITHESQGSNSGNGGNGGNGGNSGGSSSTRNNLVDFAMNYLGDAYVWGGTTLGHGVDCSGFTQAVYRHFGISLSRVSRAQACGGTRVSTSSARPGDLLFYGNSSTGYINHVAIYIGGGRILHASNPRDGIKISNMGYRTPVKCVRYLND